MELRDFAWMRLQWKRFKRLLGGATGMVLMLCSSGILFLPEEEEGESWFWARISLLVCLLLTSVVSIWLYIVARREIKRLEALSIEMRLEEARAKEERPRGQRQR